MPIAQSRAGAQRKLWWRCSASSCLRLDVGKARSKKAKTPGAHPHLRDEQMKKGPQKTPIEKEGALEGWKQVRRFRKSRGHSEEPFGETALMRNP